MTFIFYLLAALLIIAIALYLTAGQVFLFPEEAIKWNSMHRRFEFLGKTVEVAHDVTHLLRRRHIFYSKLKLYGNPRGANYTRVRLMILNTVDTNTLSVQIRCEGVVVLSTLVSKKTWKQLFGYRKDLVLYMSI